MQVQTNFVFGAFHHFTLYCRYLKHFIVKSDPFMMILRSCEILHCRKQHFIISKRWSAISEVGSRVELYNNKYNNSELLPKSQNYKESESSTIQWSTKYVSELNFWSTILHNVKFKALHWLPLINHQVKTRKKCLWQFTMASESESQNLETGDKILGLQGIVYCLSDIKP